MCKGKHGPPKGEEKKLLFRSVKGTRLRPRKPKLHLRNPHPSVGSAGFGQMFAQVVDCSEAGGLKETG